MQLTIGLAVGVGLPGLISFTSERALWIVLDGRPELQPFYNATVSTPVAYACCSSSVTRTGFEVGICAPYCSYGRGHPVYGDRISIFIPLVGGLQMTAEGALGGTIHIPLLSTFVRLGVTVLVTHARFAPVSRTILERIDKAIQIGRAWIRRRPQKLPLTPMAPPS